MWLYNEFIEVPAIRVAIVMRPINERLAGRQLGEISCSTSACHKGHEGRPNGLHMLGVLRLWATYMVNRHAQAFHHRLQATFCTDTVRLVSACPTLIFKEKFCILPVPSMRVDEARRVNHRQILPFANLPQRRSRAVRNRGASPSPIAEVYTLHRASAEALLDRNRHGRAARDSGRAKMRSSSVEERSPTVEWSVAESGSGDGNGPR